MTAREFPPFAKGPYEVEVQRSHFVPMRDGPRLSTDLYFPVGVNGRLPVILERTPYDKSVFRKADRDAPIDKHNKAWYFASHGFVFAAQDQRGKFESEGDYVVLNNDVEDAADTFDWFGRQPWFNGRVGMIGISIPAAAQIKAAQALHPCLQAIVPQAAGTGHGTAGGTMAKFWLRGGVQNLTIALWAHFAGAKLFLRPPNPLSREEFLASVDLYDGAPKVGSITECIGPDGQLKPAFAEALMHLPVVEIPKRLNSPPSDWEQLAACAPTDPWWDAGNYLDNETPVDAAALHINAWHDYGVRETLLQFNHFRIRARSADARENQFVIISPLSHGNAENLSVQTFTGERPVGDARLDFWGTYLRWFEYRLKGIDNCFAKTTPRIQYYTAGLDAWKSSDVWPIPGTRPTRLYLSSRSGANTRLGDGELRFDLPRHGGSDSYVYDPASPVFEMLRSVQVGSFDSQQHELRDDVLVYSTAPLATGIEMTGSMRALLYVSTDVVDTDLTVKIVDVYPDGRAFGLQEGYLRLRYRDGYSEPVLMEPGRVYPVEVDMLVYSNYFQPGHRIRVEITSSNMPNYARNLNTGGDNARETAWLRACVKLHHGPEHPSFIEIPVIPGDRSAT